MRRVLVFFISLWGCSLFAQDMTVRDFIGGVSTDYRVKNHESVIKYFDSAPTATPYIDKMEARASLGELDYMEQKYALRFYPKGYGETGYIRSIRETNSRANAIDHKAIYFDAIKERYLLAFDYIQAKELITLHKQLLAVMSDRITMMHRQNEMAPEPDLTLVIMEEDRYVEFEMDLIALENESDRIMFQIKELAGKEKKIEFSSAGFIPVSAVQPLVEKIERRENPDLESDKMKIQLAEQKYNLEIAKGRNYLSFFEAAYDVGKYDKVLKSFSIELAFNLPFFSPDQENINAKKVDQLMETLKFEEDSRKISEQISEGKNSLNRMVTQYNALKKRKDDSKVEMSLRKYIETDTINPVSVLKIKESMLEGDIRMTKLTYNIYQKFIELLELTGTLNENSLFGM